MPTHRAETSTCKSSSNQTADAVVITVTDYGVSMNSTDTRTGPSRGLGLPMMRTQTPNAGTKSDPSGTDVTLHFEGS
jgi:signal transduction histidine kinase